jgi:hypothetical protein
LTFNQEGFGEGNDMPVSARKVLWLCSLLLFALQSANAASDGPKSILQGIKAITYYGYVEEGIFGDECKIDWDNLKTSLEFVANQSMNLKIVDTRQHNRRRDELYSQAGELSGAAREAAKKAADDYNFMPDLVIDITPLQVQSACVGTISATLKARVKEIAHIYPTDAVPFYPRVEIWSEVHFLVGPQQTFSNRMINAAEQIMKKLVNDWAASQ